jgi:hypothetical protein
VFDWGNIIRAQTSDGFCRAEALGTWLAQRTKPIHNYPFAGANAFPDRKATSHPTERRHLVLRFPGCPPDGQAARIQHVVRTGPLQLKLVVWDAESTLEAWFDARGYETHLLIEWFAEALEIGADKWLWSPTVPVRNPDATRLNQPDTARLWLTKAGMHELLSPVDGYIWPEWARRQIVFHRAKKEEQPSGT